MLPILSMFVLLLLTSKAFASPYGIGKYNALVPYGGQTSITISTNGAVAIPISPSSAGTSNSATGIVTVVSTDVVGYSLYIRALTSTNLTNGSYQVPASSNSSPAALSINTWGYNTDASSNFTGVLATDTLIKSFTGPAENGDTTSVTYGVNVDNTKPPGQYSTTILYTAAPQTN